MPFLYFFGIINPIRLREWGNTMIERNRFYNQKAYFAKGETFDCNHRIVCLLRLKEAIQAREEAIFEALRLDFGKSAFDTYTTEILQVLDEIDTFIRHLKKWAHPKRVSPGLVHFPAEARICRQPYGVVLVISPWNYPFMLALSPLVGAVAAGNCVILKPSAQTPHTSQLLAELIADTFLPEHVTVALGDHTVSDALLELPFDFIFFTGSPAIGKKVMEKAAAHLAPVVLELGGKSPCIVDRTADLEAAARRIVWGKFVNAGQTCVAPDYLLVDRAVEQELLAHMAAAIQKFYYRGGVLSEDYPQIINRRHFDRLMTLMESGEIYCGGAGDPDTRKIAPTILRNVSPDSAVMQEEIFGPILPVLGYTSLRDAVSFVNSRPKPLALYYFSKDQKMIQALLTCTASGGACINNTVMHVASEKLPFGGVGSSGMGIYHGRYSLDTFSNIRSILLQPSSMEMKLKYPPHDKDKVKRIKRLLGR